MLAGARQGTDAPERAAQWASLLGIGKRLAIRVDFPRSELPDLLAASDIFLAPSDSVQETFGLSLVEAMAAGLPVVASDIDGYRDTVTDETGIRVPARWAADPDCLADLGPVLYERPLHLLLGQSMDVDLQAMAGAIYDLAMGDERRDAMGRAARARARARYDWRVVIRQYEEVWRRLAAEPSDSRPPVRVPAPLAMGFGALFAHYPSGRLDPKRLVARTPLADRLCDRENRYPIYPDLRVVFGDDDVMAALAAAAVPIAVGDLVQFLQTRWPQADAWRAGILVAWLLKHGLIG